MGITIEKLVLSLGNWKVGALLFLPAPDQEIKKGIALFTHGYTSHKGSLLSWPTRLAEEGMVSMIFDLPGHYLGTFSEVDDFNEFKTNAHRLFAVAFDRALTRFKDSYPLYEHYVSEKSLKVILGGHSLGALLAIKALELDVFKDYSKLCLCIGLGLTPENKTHLFQTPFYKSTLAIRAQLVSSELSPEKVFPWIRDEKKNCKVSAQRIHLITGEDDLVVGEGGVDRLAEILKANENEVSIEKPHKLAHHTPEAAAGFIKKFLKAEAIL